VPDVWRGCCDRQRAWYPADIAQILSEPVKKAKGTKGLGMGLLFAQTIVQTYGGDIRVISTGPGGTVMDHTSAGSTR
jgi:C4-dicarboxylate-specific signal transduction histidine kinase